MNISMFRHDLNASPTVRTASHTAQVKITDRPSSAVATPMRRSGVTWHLFAGPARVTRHPAHPSNGVTETKAPDTSYTTVTWPADHKDAIPLDHAHARLDIRRLRSLESQAQLIEDTHAMWGSRPVLHAFEQIAADLATDPRVEDLHEGGLDTLENCTQEAQALQDRYTAFAADASQLLAASARHDTAAASASLLRIAESIWPTLRFDSLEEKAEWVTRTLRDPRPFIAQSYDALSLALGHVNAVLSLVKTSLYHTGSSRTAAEKLCLVNSVHEGDAAYLAAEEAFNRIDIPIDPAILMGHSVLAEYSVPPA